MKPSLPLGHPKEPEEELDLPVLLMSVIIQDKGQIDKFFLSVFIVAVKPPEPFGMGETIGVLHVFVKSQQRGIVSVNAL